MARSFNGTNQFATAAPNLSSVNKLSVAFWLWQTAFDNNDELAIEYSVNAGANAGAFFVDPNSGGAPGKVELLWSSSNAHSHDVSMVRPSASVWHQWTVLIDGSLASNQITHAYIDGVDQTLTTIFATAVAASFGNFNLYFMSRAGTSLFNAGYMADVALYGGYLLSAGEALALAKGARPHQVGQTASPFFFWPFDGLVNPEPGYGGLAKNATVTGAVIAPSGPPVMPFTPRWPRFLGWTPALPAAGLGWIINRRNKLMVPKKRA